MEENLENKDWSEGLKYKSATTGFIIPDNYFSELTEKLEAAVAVERLKSLSNGEGFQMPADYFEQLNNAILAKTSGANVEPAKIKRLWHSGFLKYASAACLVIIAGLGIYFSSVNTSELAVDYAELSTEQMLFDIDEDVIIEHIEATALQQNQLSNSDVALENYILTNYSSNELTTDY